MELVHHAAPGRPASPPHRSARRGCSPRLGHRCRGQRPLETPAGPGRHNMATLCSTHARTSRRLSSSRLQGAAVEGWQPTQLSLEDAYMLSTENNLGGLAAPTEVRHDSRTHTQQAAAPVPRHHAPPLALYLLSPSLL